MKKMVALFAALIMSASITSSTLSKDIKVSADTKSSNVSYSISVTDSNSSYSSYNSYTTAKQDKLKYHGHIDSSYFKKGNTVSLKKSFGDLFTVTKYTTYCFYGFGDQAVAAHGKNGEVICNTGYDGITAKIKNNRQLEVKADSGFDTLSICYENQLDKLNYDLKKNDNGSMCLTADLWDNTFRNGFYKIVAHKYKENALDTDILNLCLIVNCGSNDSEDYEFYLCNYEDHMISENFNKKANKRHEDLIKLLSGEGVTPKNALTADYDYPYMAIPGVNDDTQYWIDLSADILEGYEKYSPSFRAMMLHDWITSHLKYDSYKVNVLHHQRYSNGFTLTDPTQFVSQNYTGVCLDFSQIYAIMCREAGIPCVVLSNDHHAWNAIYIEDLGDWFEVDLTIDVNRFVDTEDVTKVRGNTLYFYKGFMTPMVNSDTALSATRFSW